MTNRTGALSLPFRTMGVGAVLNHDQIEFLGNFHNSIHICHLGAQVYRDDCSGLFSDGLPDRLRVNTIISRIHIRNHRDRSRRDRRRSRSLE